MTRFLTSAGLLPWLFFLAVLAVVPMIAGSSTAVTVASAAAVNVVFALSYNMLLGRGGMLSFGHAVYFGLGGYAAIYALRAIEAGWLPLPVAALPLVGFAGGLLAGAVLGWPTCRRAGTPFAMLSLGVGELIAAIALMFSGLFGGEEGIAGDRTAGPALFGVTFGQGQEVLILLLGWIFLATLAMWAFTRTPLGQMSLAIRDNPDRVAFVGYDPQRVRHRVFTVAAGFGGLAGGMAAINYEIITPDMLGLGPSGHVLVMTFIGGIGTFYGPIIGAALITTMQSLLPDYTTGWQFYLGALFVLMVMFQPRGVSGLVETVRQAIADGEVRERLPRWIRTVLAAVCLAGGGSIAFEMILRWREAEEPLELAGIPLMADGATGWVLAATLAVAGLALLRLKARRVAGGRLAEEVAR